MFKKKNFVTLNATQKFRVLITKQINKIYKLYYNNLRCI